MIKNIILEKNYRYNFKKYKTKLYKQNKKNVLKLILISDNYIDIIVIRIL